MRRLDTKYFDVALSGDGQLRGCPRSYHDLDHVAFLTKGNHEKQHIMRIAFSKVHQYSSRLNLLKSDIIGAEKGNMMLKYILNAHKK